MTVTIIKRLEWKEVGNAIGHLYGSSIHFSEGQAHFSNSLLAPGKTMIRFGSRTNYQGNRQSPELPLLRPGQTYMIDSQIQTQPENRYFIQLKFFNRQNEIVGVEMVRENGHSFVYPKDAFTYELLVKSGGCHQMDFTHVTLSQETEEIFVRPMGAYPDGELPEEIELVKTLIRTRNKDLS